MDQRPPPLPIGTVLQGRFEIEAVLGQGAFGITYRAHDLQRGDQCVVRELAPLTAERDAQNILRLARSGESASQRLRQKFLQEARQTGRLSSNVAPSVRAVFVERGTAYFVREHFPQAVTLSEKVLREGRLSAEVVGELLRELSDKLEAVHHSGFLHLDLRPTNILLGKSGNPFLVDFGQSRKWYRDLFHVDHRLEGTPPEVALRGARVDRRADIYALGASLHFALTGFFPPEPSSGSSREDLAGLPAGVPSWLEEALQRSLRPDPADRPANLFAVASPLKHDAESAAHRIRTLDEKAQLLKSLRFDRRQCPSCGGVLESPRPLREEICPVCHEGRIRPRKVVQRLCPHCRMGLLKEVANLEPLSICPLCTEGRLHRRRRKLFSKEFVHGCDNCEAVWVAEGHDMVLEKAPEHSAHALGERKSCEEWRTISGRSSDVWQCAGCGAQYDRVSDGRWTQVVPAKTGKFDTLEADEWDRVAAGLPPDAGNAECDACGADYFLVDGEVALLEARNDPHHFAQHNRDRLVSLGDLRWLGVGKESPKPGLVCTECETELDFEGDQLKLVRTGCSGMLEFAGRAMSLENWHRAAKDLPLVGEEAGFEEAFALALREGFAEGAVPFHDRDANLLWRGHATRFDHSSEGWLKTGEGQLSISKEEIVYGGLIKKQRQPLAEVERVNSEDRRIDFKLASGEHFAYEIEPVDLTVSLDSGNRALSLGAADLAARLRGVLSAKDDLALA